jgi:hypothetical protein
MDRRSKQAFASKKAIFRYNYCRLELFWKEDALKLALTAPEKKVLWFILLLSLLGLVTLWLERSL